MPSTRDALSRVLALSDAVGLIPKPEVHYRAATDAAKCCATCYMNDDGNCKIVGPVEPRDVCDRWTPTVPENTTSSWPVRTSALDTGQPFRLASGFVEPYERMEKGHLERVTGYADRAAKPKEELPRSYVVRMENGDHIEVDRHRLWLHKSEGKPGPIGWATPGQLVTWRYSGHTAMGKIVGEPGLLPEGTPFTPKQGTFVDSKGDRHWGLWGGAGLLLHHTDEAGQARYLLQRRAFGIHHGGTWSTPGGAIDKPGGLVETPSAAAFREAEEEGWGNVLKAATVTGVQQEHFGGTPGEKGVWTYHTVSAAVPDMIKPSGKGSHAGEATGAKWVTPEEMAKLPLHPDFVATANKLGRPADVPNPTIGGDSKWGPSPAPRHPLVRDDYKAGRRVTWRFKGKPAEGVVEGPGPLGKDGWPVDYKIKTDNGQNVSVMWGALRLHPSENPKDAAKAQEWENKQHHTPSLPKTGYGHPTSSNVIKAHSLALPGLTHSVPSEVNGKPVVGVLEHPKKKNLILQLQGDHAAGFMQGKVHAVSPGHSSYQEKLAKEGWKLLPISPPQDPGVSSGPLGKVIDAAKDIPPY